MTVKSDAKEFNESGLSPFQSIFTESKDDKLCDNNEILIKSYSPKKMNDKNIEINNNYYNKIDNINLFNNKNDKLCNNNE
jgi:hypothetical protein